MRADNDNIVSDPFSRLPLFASDAELAAAIVGKERAKTWLRERLPTIAGKAGFPPVDAFHGGRPVPLVKAFYSSYLGAPHIAAGKSESKERPDAWHKKRA